MCVFCEIVKGNIPSSKVYEDENYLAILDLSQVTLGHTLVMPKKHYDNFLEMGSKQAGELMSIVNVVANKVVKNLDASGCNILNNTNEVAGQTVMHTHVHIIPRYNKDDSIKIEFSENKYDLNEVLKKING